MSNNRGNRQREVAWMPDGIYLMKQERRDILLYPDEIEEAFQIMKSKRRWSRDDLGNAIREDRDLKSKWHTDIFTYLLQDLEEMEIISKIEKKPDVFVLEFPGQLTHLLGFFEGVE